MKKIIMFIIFSVFSLIIIYCVCMLKEHDINLSNWSNEVKHTFNVGIISSIMYGIIITYLIEKKY